MKRVFALILSAVLLFSLSGCVKIYRQAWDGFCYTSYDEPVELDKEAVNYILDIMNSGKWQSGNIKCPSDYYFSLQLGRVGYVSDEGYFNDFTLQRSMKLTDEQREKVNEFLFNYNRVKIVGRVTEKYDGGCLIEITSDTEENVMAEGTPVMVHIGDAECPEYEVGDVLIIIFNGMVAESYPPQIFSVYEVYKSESDSEKTENKPEEKPSSFIPEEGVAYSFDEIYHISDYINVDEICEIWIDYANVSVDGYPILHDVSMPTDSDTIEKVKDFIKNTTFTLGNNDADGVGVHTVIISDGNNSFEFSYGKRKTFYGGDYSFIGSTSFPSFRSFMSGYFYIENLNDIELSSYGTVTSLTDFDLCEIQLSKVNVDTDGYDYTKDADLTVDGQSIKVMSDKLIYWQRHGWFYAKGEKDFSALIPDGETSSTVTFQNSDGRVLGKIYVSNNVVYTAEEIYSLARALCGSYSFDLICSNGESYADRVFTSDEMLTVEYIFHDYDGTPLNRLIFSTVDYNGGSTAEYTIDFDENTVKYRGFLPYEESEPEYKIVKEFTDKDEEILLNKLYSNGLFELEDYYSSPDGIVDGGGWDLIIEYRDGSVKESGGSNNSPKYIFSGCAKAFYDLCGYGIVGSVSPDYYSPPNISYSFSKKDNGGMMNYSSFCHRGDYSWNGFGSSGNDIYELNVAKKTPYQYYADEEYKLLIYTANYNNIYNYEKFTRITITSYDYNESLTNEKEVYSGGWFSQASIDIELEKIYLVRLDFDNGDFVEWTFNTLTTERSE